MEIIASDEMKAYFQRLEDEVIELYKVAEKAREKGLDPELEPEIHLAKDVAGKVEGLIEIKGIADRIRSLTLQMDRENVAFKIAQEIADGKLVGNISEEKKADLAIRAALAILTEGVTAAPLEGIAKVKIKRNEDNTRYLAIYFAGPIRAAGGTEAALTVLVSDHVRKVLGLSRYKATRQEMMRFVEEIDLYNRVMHLQSPTTTDQIETAVENLPVEVTGEKTNPEEVSAFRDLPRIETNCLRGGACLVLNDGIIGRAMKILRTVNAVGLTDWDWLKDLKATVAKAQDDQEKEEQKAKTQPSYGYIKDVISGRPIFSHPSQPGGFRIRYGHSRNTGLAGIGIHPATMKVVMEFLAPGTHIRTERPGKGSVVMPVDSIDGPIVLLKDGTVLQLDSYEQAEKYSKKIKEILFLGDLLVGFGEFLENNHPLIPSGFVEEWWVLYLESRIKSRCDNDLAIAAKTVGMTIERLRDFLNHPIATKPTQEEALSFCYELLLPLHPYYTYAWHDISFDEFFELRDQILERRITDKQKISQYSRNPKAIILDQDFSAKRFLERIGLPHRVKDGCVVIEENNLIIEHCMQLENKELDPSSIERTVEPPFEYIVPFEIKMKNPIYSGARMGRPEKAKERKMNPPVHTLYPLEMEGGGNNRLILEAGKKKKIEITVIQRECKTCSIITHLSSCPNCQRGTEVIRSCYICGVETEDTFCKECKRPTVTYNTRLVNIAQEITRVKKALGGSIPPKTKGVKKLMNRGRIPEILEKGFLRARHGLNVYKDGTIRFDSTDIPLMHFKPREVSATLEQLNKLGYTEDANGEPLTDEEQICELKIQDVVLNIDNGEFLVRVSKYVDDMLESVYGLPRFYNITRITELIGHLIIGLAPHTSSGITGRVIGFTSVKGNLAHPYWHAAKRRNCFPGDTEVLVDIEGKITRVKIKDLYENEFDNEIEEKMVLVKKQPKREIKAYSFDHSLGEVTLTNILDVIKTPAPEHLVKFHLVGKRSYTTTAGHPVIVHEDGKLVEKRASEVSKGDMFILPSLRLDEEDIQEIDLLKEFTKNEFIDIKDDLMVRGISSFVQTIVDKYGLKELSEKLAINKKTLNNYYRERDSMPLSVLEILLKFDEQTIMNIPHCTLGFKRDHTFINRIIPFNDSLMKLIGYYLAEGFYRKVDKLNYQVDLAVSESDLREDMLSSIAEVFGKGFKPYIDSNRITISSRIIYQFFKNILQLQTGSRNKAIPSFLLKLPKNKIKHLISTYFSGDGGVDRKNGTVLCSSFSKELLKDFDFLLLRFGIYSGYSSYSRNSNTEYKLAIRGENALAFSDKISFTSKRKQELLDGIVKSKKIKSQKTYKNNRLLTIKKKEIIKSRTEFVYSLNAENYHNILVNEYVLTHQCDGDEDAVILMLEGFLDFSKQFLPITRGGSMDAPLTLGLILNPLEVDDESHAVDCTRRYPLEFYEQSFKFIESKKIAQIIDLIGNRLETPEQFENFYYTHETSDIGIGPISTAYSRFGKMSEKLEAQLAVAKLIRAVHLEDVAERVINKHFFPDMIGCLRAFGTQTFRCVRCNTKYRRLPLTGKCTACDDGGKLLLTVHKKTITKYFETANNLIKTYKLSEYLKQRLELFNNSIDEYFIKEIDDQSSLMDFFGEST
ncbi:MAG: DNA-directed DNA polymerase II large subunit [Asgard group archaeon]|nr:DNA-directed DNA polymerase II large subunit [Asgard group archaeon]